MAGTPSDRNLLVGVLALQLGFISKDQLIAALAIWLMRKEVALEVLLREQKALSEDGLQKLQAVVQIHLDQHGGDPEKSLAALSSVGGVRGELAALRDPDLEASLHHVSLPTNSPSQDPFRTFAVGQSSSEQLRFRILRPHAKGGLGEVSVALDSELNREVALKEIQPKFADFGESRARFMLEAQITGGLEHPGIVPVYGMGTYADGRPFYAMRFIHGDSLKDGVRKFFAKFANKPLAETEDDLAQGVKLPAAAYESLDFRQLLGRFVDVCNAIAYAHARGVLHRDLKPGNIMLGNYGETLVVDWGLAKATGKSDESLDTSQAPLSTSASSDSEATRHGSALGTPGYMSPEQAAGRIDRFGPATDIYCLGATLYHLLTGRAPHHDVGSEDFFQRIQQGRFSQPRSVNPAIPPPLASICLKAMALEPSARYASALELAADIEHWLADDPVAAHRDSLLVQAQRWIRRHRQTAALSALLIVASLVVAVISFRYQAIVTQGLADKEALARRVEREQAAAEHQREVARSQKLLAALTGVQANSASRPAGWIASNLESLAALEIPADDASARRLARSEIAKALSTYDLRPLRTLSSDFSAAAIAFSPDGKWLAAGAYKAGALGQVQVRLLPVADGLTAKTLTFNMALGDVLAKLGEIKTDGVKALCFSPDGQRLVAGSRTGWLHEWKLSDDKPAVSSWRAHEGNITGVQFAADGQSLYSCGHDGHVQRWSLAHESLAKSEALAKLFGLCQTESSIIATSNDGFRLLELTSLERRADPRDAEYGFDLGIAATPDGRGVVLGSSDHLTLISLGFRGKPRHFVDGRTLTAHVNSPEQIAIDPASRWVASVDNTSIKLWNYATRELLSERPLGGAWGSLAFHPTAPWLAVANDRGVELLQIDLGVGSSVAQQPLPLWSFAASETGQRVVSMSFSEPFDETNWAFVVLDQEGRQRKRHQQTGDARYITLAPDGSIWITGDQITKSFFWVAPRAFAEPQLNLSSVSGIDFLVFEPQSGKLWCQGREAQLIPGLSLRGAHALYEFDPTTYRQIHSISNLYSEVSQRKSGFSALAAMPKKILAASDDLTLKIVDTENRTLLHTLSTGGATVDAIAPLPRLGEAVLGDRKGRLTLVEVARGEILGSRQASSQAIPSLSATADGALIASGSSNGELKLWRRAAGKLEEILAAPLSARAITRLQLSGDGNRLAYLILDSHAVQTLDLATLRAECQRLRVGW